MHCEWPAIEFIQLFLTGYTSSHEWCDINIYIPRTTKLLTSIIESFIILKVLIQNERIWWFAAQNLRSAFVQDIVIVGYVLSLPSFIMNSCLYQSFHKQIFEALALSPIIFLKVYQICENLETFAFGYTYINSCIEIC